MNESQLGTAPAVAGNVGAVKVKAEEELIGLSGQMETREGSRFVLRSLVLWLDTL